MSAAKATPVSVAPLFLALAAAPPLPYPYHLRPIIKQTNEQTTTTGVKPRESEVIWAASKLIRNLSSLDPSSIRRRRRAIRGYFGSGTDDSESDWDQQELSDGGNAHADDYL